MPVKTEISVRVTHRFSAKTTKPKGDLHILAIYHSYNWEGPSFELSLAAFGKVKHLDWRNPALAGMCGCRAPLLRAGH